MKQAQGETIPAAARSVMSTIDRAADSGPATGPLEAAFAPIVERRRAGWNRRFADAVSEIGRRAGESRLTTLGEDDHFLTVSLEAAQIACRNHHEEKLDALRCAVVHAALPGAPGEHIQLIFLRFIDELTPVHLGVLSLIEDPAQWMDAHGIGRPGWRWGTVSSLIQFCIPTLRGQSEAIEQVLRELQARGLAEPGQYLRTPTSESGMLASRTTAFGKSFLAYIGEHSPLEQG